MAGKKSYRWLWYIPVSILVIILGVVIWGISISESKPEGKTGPEADALAQKMMEAVNIAAWDTTGAITWIFNGSSQQKHLWDKERHFARVSWNGFEVLVDINNRSGIAYQNGQEVSGETADQLVDQAWKMWVNDSFWLNPVVKAFDGGTTRSIVDLEGGGKGLMVTYGSGGATPGDAYLWILDDNNRPKSWKMWVNIIPIGGIESTWDGWQQLSTGAWVANSHAMGAMNLTIEGIDAAATLAELVPGADPFAALVN